MASAVERQPARRWSREVSVDVDNQVGIVAGIRGYTALTAGARRNDGGVGDDGVVRSFNVETRASIPAARRSDIATPPDGLRHDREVQRIRLNADGNARAFQQREVALHSVRQVRAAERAIGITRVD